jgi:hypothetical protein
MYINDYVLILEEVIRGYRKKILLDDSPEAQIVLNKPFGFKLKSDDSFYLVKHGAYLAHLYKRYRVDQPTEIVVESRDRKYIFGKSSTLKEIIEITGFM